MPQSLSMAFPRHQMKERWGSNKDNTNATYETTDAQTKKNCNPRTVLEGSVGKLVWGLNQLYSCKTSPCLVCLVSRQDTCTFLWNYNDIYCFLDKKKKKRMCTHLHLFGKGIKKKLTFLYRKKKNISLHTALNWTGVYLQYIYTKDLNNQQGMSMPNRR